MADPAVAARATGYVVGISPIGQRRAHPTVVYVSALDHLDGARVGRAPGLDVELAPGTPCPRDPRGSRGSPAPEARTPPRGYRAGLPPRTWR